jgi:hypothetical protein
MTARFYPLSHPAEQTTRPWVFPDDGVAELIELFDRLLEIAGPPRRRLSKGWRRHIRRMKAAGMK